MKYLLPALTLLISCASPNTLPNRSPDFVSSRATEAELEFTHWVDKKSRTKPTPALALEHVEKQILHLFGPMERAETSAVPKEDHQISIEKVEKLDSGDYRITYSYTGTVVVEKGPRKYLEIILPNNPDTIYTDSLVNDKTYCSDPHYPNEGDFWYFWSPDAYSRKCPLKEGVHFSRISAHITREKNDSISYPEYHRLADRQGEIEIWALFGMDDPSQAHDPLKSKDTSAASYRGLRSGLLAMGFQSVEISADLLERWVPEHDSSFTLERLEKKSGKQNLVVNLFFGESGIDEKSQAFHYLFRRGIKDSAILIYDGHSGLGGHLDLAEIAKLRDFEFEFPKDKYQIFFFNSCTSYTYYNARYLQRKMKRGRNQSATKHLDLLVNGLATYFDEEQIGNLALIRAVDRWAKSGVWTSYQTLAKRIDTENLFAVIGDEDNPNKPLKK
jgi:hypothetical protein